MRSRSGGLVALFSVAVVSAGCGDEERGPTPDPLPSASTCSDSWKQMFQGLQAGAAYAGPLSFANDLVIYSTNSGIHTLSTETREYRIPSGRVNTVTEDPLPEVFRGSQLWGVPIAGGTPALLLDGGPRKQSKRCHCQASLEVEFR